MFTELKSTDACSTGKTARKFTKILQSFGFQLEVESFNSVKYHWCYEHSKVGIFSGSFGLYCNISQDSGFKNGLKKFSPFRKLEKSSSRYF